MEIDPISFDYSLEARPLDLVNGDMGLVLGLGDRWLISLIDGAGHGPEAHQISEQLRLCIVKHKNKKLVSIMNSMDALARGTPGGVAILASLNIARSEINYVSVGNVGFKKFGRKNLNLMSQDGVLGYAIRTSRENKLPVSKGDVLIFHTDGISSQFDLMDYPNILKDDVGVIGKNLIKKFGKENDDATCIVLKIK